MELWTAFLLGLLGSLHCAGMCGPLALALPGPAGQRPRFVLGRLWYNAGRLTTYAAIGLVFGVIGQSVALVGLQRWLSFGAGVLVLTGWLASSRVALNTPAWRVAGWLKGGLGRLLQRNSLAAAYGFGAVNGLLPCGLVYVAAAGAATHLSLPHAVGTMLTFGLGTVPMMFAMGMAGAKLQFVFRFRLQRLIPISVGVVGVLLVLRGLALGIPYLSPNPSGTCSHCGPAGAPEATVSQDAPTVRNARSVVRSTH